MHILLFSLRYCFCDCFFQDIQENTHKQYPRLDYCPLLLSQKDAQVRLNGSFKLPMDENCCNFAENVLKIGLVVIV